MFEDDFDELDNFENYLEKDKSRAKRRHKDVSKALRKASISKLVYQFNWYDNLHQYSKNKVHCSCPLCSCKTNTKIYKSRGPMSNHHMRQTGSNHRYGKKNYKLSDLRRMDSMFYEDKEAM